MQMTRQLLNYGHAIPEPQYGYRQQVPVFTRPNPRTDPLGRQPTRCLPNAAQIPALAGHDASGPPRRRIPVAVCLLPLASQRFSDWKQCGRCRKRKIRCSGDPGDASGCNNCKQAGVQPGVCVFLRVLFHQIRAMRSTAYY